MDFWTECELIEQVEGKLGGRPVIKGTRIEPELLVIEAELGRTPEQTHEDFPTVSVKTILAVQAYAQRHAQLVP